MTLHARKTKNAGTAMMELYEGVLKALKVVARRFH
jgi:hypothetical protein